MMEAGENGFVRLFSICGAACARRKRGGAVARESSGLELWRALRALLSDPDLAGELAPSTTTTTTTTTRRPCFLSDLDCALALHTHPNTW